MARGNPGILYKTQKGFWAIAYHKEQEQEFIKRGKVYVHIHTPELQPVLDESGKPTKGLMAKEKLTRIGFVD